MLLASVALLATGVPAAPAVAGQTTSARRAPDRAGIGLQLIDIPVARVKDPRALAYIVDHVRPGTTIKRRVEVRNTTGRRQHVELYAGAAKIDGNVFAAADGRGGNDLSGWVRLESNSVDLPPGGRKRVRVTVAVPETAPAGERYGAIWAQISSPPSDGGNVLQIHRVGVRMYLDIGLGGEPPSDFRVDGMAVGPGDGTWPAVTAWVENTGGRALDMAGNLHLSSTSGTVRAGPFPVTNGVTILPGQRGQVSVLVNQPLSAGRWKARLELTSGTVKRTAEAELTLNGSARAAEPTDRRWLVFGPGIGLALVLLVGLLGWRRRRRRRVPVEAPTGRHSAPTPH
ncbi:hypothetical protein [Plantactinospora endophytica]|uniref:Peptidase n=1 Tax=Plantactinospora endophytica TaxID=673535 RepID=A0ABQ4E684_9ACTN|nr:hypothetical protein [Plantactinospora endophytica]GIG90183.1 hypothetical protein Pen02_51190 [Plantactinospora endophytica]